MPRLISPWLLVCGVWMTTTINTYADELPPVSTRFDTDGYAVEDTPNRFRGLDAIDLTPRSTERDRRIASPERIRTAELTPMQTRTSQQGSADNAEDASIVTTVPTISIETAVPQVINVGKNARIVITVTNPGDVTADGLEIRTTLSHRMKLINAVPRPTHTDDDELRFHIGTFPAKAARQIVLEMMPQTTGPVDLLATASFSAAARASLQVRKPQLVVSCKAPEQATFGESLTYELIVNNVGDGEASDIMLSPRLPREAVVVGESDRQLQVGWLAPGQAKKVLVSAKAIAGGILDARFVVTDSSGSEVEATHQMRIHRPVVEVDIKGPSVNFLKREGVYEVRVSNPGDAPAEDVRVLCELPRGLELTVLGRKVTYDRANNRLAWRIESLPAGDSDVLQFKARGIGEGEQVQAVMVTANAGLSADSRHMTLVISRPNINVMVINRDGPLDVNAAAHFQVTLKNVGTKTAENVRIRVVTPEAMEAVPSETYKTINGDIIFPSFSLAVNEQRVLKFEAIGREAGDHIVGVLLESDSFSRQLTVEGSAFFYDSRDQRFAPYNLKPQMETTSLTP